MDYIDNIKVLDETYQVEDPEAVKTEGGELEETKVSFDDKETTVESWDDFIENHFESGVTTGQWFKDFKAAAQFLGESSGELTGEYDEDTRTLKFSSVNIIIPTLELKPLSECSVSEIQKIAQSGQAADIWSVGDTIPIVLNGTVGMCTFDNETWYAEIIGFDHNAELETGGSPSVTFQFGVTEDGTKVAFIDGNYDSTGSSDGFRMNTSSTSSGGWESSYMRNTICPQFLAAMPQEWQDIIKPTIKYTDNVGDGSGHVESNVTATEDKIFLLSYHEVGFTSTNANSYEANYTEPYSDRYSSNDDRIRYQHSATDSTCSWWGRSARRSYGSDFCYVSTSGTDASSNRAAHYSYGFAPALCIF